MALLSQEPSLSVADLAEKIKKSTSAIERAIRSLREQSLIERVGAKKTGYWNILKQIDDDK